MEILDKDDQPAMSERSQWISEIALRAVSLIRSSNIADTVKTLVEKFDAAIFSNSLIGDLEVLAFDKAIGREFDTIIIVVQDPLPRELLTLVTRAKKRLIFVQGEGESLHTALQIGIDKCICLE